MLLITNPELLKAAISQKEKNVVSVKGHNVRTEDYLSEGQRELLNAMVNLKS